ncbi:MAG: sugar phosphate isomerase/epimerase [Verrucomicrobia bacterium]|nr:sugar phosphate isomerase/epimerase [Verrucomicrobiota bacterium]
MFTMHTLKLLVVISAAVSLSAACAQAEVKIPNQYKTGGFAIGCQAYSFNRFTVFEAIEKTAETGSKVIEFYPGQRVNKDDKTTKFSHDSPPELIAQVKAALKKHGIMAVNYGVVGIPADEAAARKIFDFAKKMGIYAITTESVDALDTAEKLAKKYDICVAIHNHPKNEKKPDYKVWDPNYVLSIVKGRDRRIGASADTGHWSTSGLDPLECVKTLKGRIISVHLKDRNLRGREQGMHDVPFGTGVLNIKAILDELKRQKFAGNISIEYEHNWENSVPDIKQCIDFVRSCGK